MKLLVITQKVDKNDSVLGFFHNWLTKLAPNFEKLNVICLEKGEYHLPENTHVSSLGKENRYSILKKLRYIWNFYKLISDLEKDYDAVFVHMNQEYILLAGLYWRVIGKKVYFWRNHPQGSILTRVSVMLSDQVFCTSPDSYTARFYKTKIMPVGIDTDLFDIENPGFNIPNSILSLGRLSPIKNIHVLIGVLKNIYAKGQKFTADIIGNPVNKEDFEYVKSLESDAVELIQNGTLSFLPSVNQEGAAVAYKSHQVFVNLTPRGSMDKTILEAAACGVLPLARNDLLRDIDPNLVIESDDLVEIEQKLTKLLAISDSQAQKLRHELRNFVVEKHSLSALIEVLTKQIQNV